MLQKTLCFLFVVVFLSCSKKDQADQDGAVPVITLLTPANAQVFAAGTSISITASISDDTRLAEIHVHIYNQATGQLVADIHRYPNAATYSLDENFTVQAGINYTIRVLAIDRTGKEASQSVAIVVN